MTDHPASDLMSPAERVETVINGARGPVMWTYSAVRVEAGVTEPPPPDDRLSEAQLCEIEARASEWRDTTYIVYGEPVTNDGAQSMDVNILLSFPQRHVPTLIDEIRRQRDQIHDLTTALASMHRTMHAPLGKECPS